MIRSSLITGVVLVFGCSGSYSITPRSTPQPEEAIRFELELGSRSSALLTLSGGGEQINVLSSVYQEFHVEVGEPVKGVIKGFALHWDKSLDLPWERHLNGPLPWPFRVRLVGYRNDGKRVIIRERVFHQGEFY